MKKLFLLILVVFSGMGIIYSQTIKVDDPGSGSSWEKGKAHTITWTKTGTQDANVKIRLYDISSATKIKDITNSTSNIGSFTTPSDIFDDVNPGSYRIRVKTLDNQVTDDSDIFEIQKKSGSTFEISKLKGKMVPFITKIKILKPSQGKYWDEGKSYYIQWENTFTKNKSIKIDLYNSSGTKFKKNIKTIIVTTPKFSLGNISKTKWTIPKGTFKLFSNGWRIKITRLDPSNISGLSEKFYVRKSGTVKKHKIYGTTYNKVKWSKKGKKSFTYYETPAADPGPGKMRVGYQNFNNDSSSSSYIYRSYIMFNTSGLKGTVLSAKLRYKVFMGSSGCIKKVSNVDGDWTKNLFGVALSHIPHPNDGMQSFIQGWLNNPETNHGILISGDEGKFKQWGTYSCVAYADNVYLELEILE